jgi:hypothetical protein
MLAAQSSMFIMSMMLALMNSTFIASLMLGVQSTVFILSEMSAVQSSMCAVSLMLAVQDTVLIVSLMLTVQGPNVIGIRNFDCPCLSELIFNSTEHNFKTHTHTHTHRFTCTLCHWWYSRPWLQWFSLQPPAFATVIIVNKTRTVIRKVVFMPTPKLGWLTKLSRRVSWYLLTWLSADVLPMNTTFNTFHFFVSFCQLLEFVCFSVCMRIGSLACSKFSWRTGERHHFGNEVWRFESGMTVNGLGPFIFDDTFGIFVVLDCLPGAKTHFVSVCLWWDCITRS